jgi:hypothetical protein
VALRASIFRIKNEYVTHDRLFSEALVLDVAMAAFATALTVCVLSACLCAVAFIASLRLNSHIVFLWDGFGHSDPGSTNGSHLAPVDFSYTAIGGVGASTWNNCAVVLGALIGLFVYWSFIIHDQLLHEKSLKPWYLCSVLFPAKRTRTLQSSIGVSWAVISLLPVVLALSIVAAGTLFGVQDHSYRILGSFASVPTPMFEKHALNFLPEWPFPEPEEIGPYFWRAAVRFAARASDNSGLADSIRSHEGIVGHTIYGDFGFAPGMGIDLPALSGFFSTDMATKRAAKGPLGLKFPVSGRFESLDATVYATSVKVECTDVTENYEILREVFLHNPDDVKGEDQGISMARVKVQFIPDWVVYDRDVIEFPPGDKSFKTRERAIGVRSILQVHRATQPGGPWLKHTIAIAERNGTTYDPNLRSKEEFLPVVVAECTYTGRDNLVRARADAKVPNRVDMELVSEGEVMDPTKLARAAHGVRDLIHFQSGGALGYVLKKFDLGPGTYRENVDIPGLLSDILTETAGMYHSVVRQRLETMTMVKELSTNVTDGRIRNNTVTIMVPRVGGGGSGWLAVPAILGVSALVSVVRLVACIRCLNDSSRRGEEYAFKPLPGIPEDEEDRSLPGSPYPGDESRVGSRFHDAEEGV